eukprot:CAMPEP_0181453470 /NCGR_PEP_ID=MMETSP1110-20121109/29744_1 /TAXON_ID=174948 /ORGANISM="Symbiodinium sp., Strain CCMP421" /LENGTH=89 /DNA_ID=CAMNT_0023577795 /DNA_START=54 /DNA_END=323 /DNA_ORIENTATION=+
MAMRRSRSTCLVASLLILALGAAFCGPMLPERAVDRPRAAVSRVPAAQMTAGAALEMPGLAPRGFWQRLEAFVRRSMLTGQLWAQLRPG